MSAEWLIFASVLFSVFLSAVGWAVQWKLMGEKSKSDDTNRYLQKMLHRLEVDLVVLSERHRTWETTSLMIELMGHETEFSNALRQEMLSKLRGKLAVLPSEEQMRLQMNDIAKALSQLSHKVSQPTTATRPTPGV